IVGTGYTGSILYSQACRRGYERFATSRSPHVHLSHIPAGRRIEFDLSQSDTWKNIPVKASLIWCFPAAPIDHVRAFAEMADLSSRPLVVLGSTSAYGSPAPSLEDEPLWLDESAPIDLALPRVQGEEYLRLSHQAMVLRVAGIYGPRRNPIDWIRQGRVTPSLRYVNLIHVEDLADICLRALDRGTAGEIYNVSDGTPRTWGEICEVVQHRWGVVPREAVKGGNPGKRISNAKLRTELGYTFRYPDLYEALELIESGKG
ncbi:MAG: hypothetical protein ACT4OO_03790, partial [Nitrospiraceae bacterium]